MIFALIAISLIAFAVLAMRESPLWQWGLAVAAIGLLSGLGFPDGGIGYGLGAGGWVLLVIGAVLLVLSVAAIRKPLLVAPIYGAVKSILPRVSRTEQEALDVLGLPDQVQVVRKFPDHRNPAVARKAGDQRVELPKAIGDAAAQGDCIAVQVVGVQEGAQRAAHVLQLEEGHDPDDPRDLTDRMPP